MLNITRGDSDGVLRIAGSADIGTAEALQAALADQLSRASSLTLDLSAVEACDTAAIQLLYSARKSAVRYGKSFSICAISCEVRRVAELLGLQLDQLSGEPEL